MAANGGDTHGVVSSCKVSHGQTQISCQMMPLLRAAPPVMRPENQPWPPPPSAIVSSPDSLNRWLQLAVQVKSEMLDKEADLEHQQFFWAGASLASHITIRQQLANLPIAVKLQLFVSMVLVGLVISSSVSLFLDGAEPGAGMAELVRRFVRCCRCV